MQSRDIFRIFEWKFPAINQLPVGRESGKMKLHPEWVWSVVSQGRLGYVDGRFIPASNLLTGRAPGSPVRSLTAAGRECRSQSPEGEREGRRALAGFVWRLG